MFMISLFTHRQFSRHKIIICQQWTKASNISKDNVSSTKVWRNKGVYNT
jgi:hypothetical protein